MTGQGSLAAGAVARLRASIERTAASLASPQLDVLLACEADTEAALAGLPPLHQLTPDERQQMRAEIDRARAALLRCRRLGASLEDFVRLSFDAQGRGPYGRGDAATSGIALDTRG